MKSLMTALTLTLLSSSALAASPEPVRSRFYIFEGTSIESGTKGPALDVFGPRQAARFGRLLELKKDFTPGIGQALKDRAFK